MNTIVLGWAGQSLVHVPDGAVSSPTFELEDLGYPIGHAKRVIASGEATAASWSLTTSAVAGATQRNGRRIAVTATAGAAIGAPAVIVAPDGTRELLEIAAVSADAYVESASSMAGVYPSGSTVSGVLLSASVPDDFADDEKRFKLRHAYRVTWTYTLDGKSRRVPEFVHVTRANTAADESLGEAVIWVTTAYPTAQEQIGEQPKISTIAKLMAGEVAGDVRARGRDPETFLIGDQGRGLLVARILAHMGDLGWAPGNQDREKWAVAQRSRYEAKLDRLTIGTPGQATAESDLLEDTSPGTPSKAEKPFMLGL